VTNTRVYYERIDLHPLSVALSFAQTVADQKRVGFGGNVMEVVKNLASISRAPVQMKSFQVEHAMETPASFTHIVLAHYKRQAFAQILTIAGSLSTLGSPVDLVTSVGTGVKDFFYEPINGLVHSPKVRVLCASSLPPSLPPSLLLLLFHVDWSWSFYLAWLISQLTHPSVCPSVPLSSLP